MFEEGSLWAIVITMLSMHKHFTLTTFYRCLEENKMSKQKQYTIIYNTIIYTPVWNSPSSAIMQSRYSDTYTVGNVYEYEKFENAIAKYSFLFQTKWGRTHFTFEEGSFWGTAINNA